MDKHTKGPWKFDCEFGLEIFPPDEGRPICELWRRGKSEQEKANGRLIASAPEFYEAADNFVRWIDTYGCTMDEHMLRAMEAAFGAKLRAALARARGQSEE